MEKVQEKEIGRSGRRLLMISTDRNIFEDGSPVRARQAGYARDWDEVHIVVFSGKGPKEQSIAPNCWAYPTSSPSRFMYPFDAMRLGRFIIEKRGITDITCQDASLTAMAGSSLKREFSRKGMDLALEIQVHEDIGAEHYTFSVKNRIRKAMALSYLPKADKVRVVSERIKDYIVGSLGIDPAKVSVRPIAVDKDAIKASPVIASADLQAKYPQFFKIVLMVSRLEPEKNVSLAIEAWANVIDKLPKAGLVIVGSGSDMPKLKRLVSKLGLSGSVAFEGRGRDMASIYSCYKTADLFLNTSLFEGYGMALVEAAAAGTKIVSTDVGVAREVGASIVDWTPESVAEGIARALP